MLGDPAIFELNRLTRLAKLFKGDDETYLKHIHKPIIGLLHDAPYLLKTDAFAGYISQEYKRITELHIKKGETWDDHIQHTTQHR